MYQRDYTTGGLTFNFVIKICTYDIRGGLYEGEQPRFSVTVSLDEEVIGTYFKNSIADSDTIAIVEADKIALERGFTTEEVSQLETLKYKIIENQNKMRESKEYPFQPAVEKSCMKDREVMHYDEVACEPVQLQVQHYAAHVFNEIVNYTIEDQDRFLGEIREKLVNARRFEIEQLALKTKVLQSSLNHLIP